MNRHTLDLLFGEAAFPVSIALAIAYFIFYYFVMASNYRKWWIYKIIMGKKAKPVIYKKWMENEEERAQREAEEARARAQAAGEPDEADEKTDIGEGEAGREP